MYDLSIVMLFTLSLFFLIKIWKQDKQIMDLENRLNSLPIGPNDRKEDDKNPKQKRNKK